MLNSMLEKQLLFKSHKESCVPGSPLRPGVPISCQALLQSSRWHQRLEQQLYQCQQSPLQWQEQWDGEDAL